MLSHTWMSDLFLWDFLQNPRDFNCDLDSLRHLVCLIAIPAGWLTTRSGHIGSSENWDLIPSCSWPEGTPIKCPQVSDSVVHQHLASNVVGDTNQR